MDKKTKIIIGLSILVFLLIGFISYKFLLQPWWDSYMLKKQIETKDIILGTMLQQIKNQGYIKITNENGEYIILAPVNS
jgi:hypothetical protein